MNDRQHDVVIFGATGFTGALTAEYLASHAPRDLRWGLAGRNRQKLERIRDRLVQRNQSCADLPLIAADIGDHDSLRTVAQSTKVVITTVGPYTHYGEPVVAACARAGTDYVDLTGEPEFVDRMWLRYHDEAARSGARIVHSCGFDSLPHDLGALFTVEELPEGVPIKLEGFVRVSGTVSGGTYQTAINSLGRMRQGLRAGRERARRDPRPAGRKVKGAPGVPHHDAAAGGWVLPFPTIDPQTVLRSARALDRYGPEFTYSHYLVVRRLPVAVGLMGGAAAAIALAQVPPTRRLLLQLKSAGEGPSEEQRERASFRVRLVGEADGKRVIAEVSGGDPGYGETSKMLAEAAVCLARDQLPERAGQLTPAVAMGDALIGRLQGAGIRFEALQS